MSFAAKPMPNSTGSEPIGVEFCWLEHGRDLAPPELQSAGAAGADLCAALAADEEVLIAPGARQLIPCGFAMALPMGFEGQVRARSGLALKFGIGVLNAPGTIDADYRGEVKVILINHGQTTFAVRRGDRIAQLVVAPVTRFAFKQTEALEATTRGTNGFGSTGHRGE